MYTVYSDIHGKINNLVDATLELSAGDSGSLDFKLSPFEAEKYNLKPMTELIFVKDRTNSRIWSGRIIESGSDFYGNVTYHCEGLLAALNDAVADNINYQSADVAYFINTILTKYRKTANPNMEIYIGSVEDSFKISASSNYDQTLMELLKSTLIDKHGGYLILRHTASGYLLDYKWKLSTASEAVQSSIDFGKNLLDFTSKFSLTDICTRIIPFGKTSEDGTTVTIESVNNGINYIENEDAVKEFGIVTRTITFDEIETPKELLEQAKLYLSVLQFNEMELEVSAIDLGAAADSDYKPWNILDAIHCKSAPHGLDGYFPITSMSIDLLHPENNTLTLGKSESASLTTASSVLDREVKNMEMDVDVDIDAIIERANAEATKMIDDASKEAAFERELMAQEWDKNLQEQSTAIKNEVDAGLTEADENAKKYAEAVAKQLSNVTDGLDIEFEKIKNDIDQSEQDAIDAANAQMKAVTDEINKNLATITDTNAEAVGNVRFIRNTAYSPLNSAPITEMRISNKYRDDNAAANYPQWAWVYNGAGISYRTKSAPNEAWVNAGIAMTTDGKISADFITTGTLDASKITVKNLNAGAITTGTLDASKITVKNLNASAISAGIIYSQQTGDNSDYPGSYTRFILSAGSSVMNGRIEVWNATTRNYMVLNATGLWFYHVDEEGGAKSLGACILNDGTINGNKIHALTVQAGAIAAGAITSTKIAASAITADKIAAGAITSTKIAASAITADKIATGAISASTITAGVLTSKDGNCKFNLDGSELTITTASGVWRFNSAGLGFKPLTGSTYSLALTSGGAINADRITTGTLNASRIKVGVLSDAEGLNSWDLVNGNLTIKKGVLEVGITKVLENGESQQQAIKTTEDGTAEFYIVRIGSVEVLRQGLGVYINDTETAGDEGIVVKGMHGVRSTISYGSVETVNSVGHRIAMEGSGFRMVSGVDSSKDRYIPIDSFLNSKEGDFNLFLLGRTGGSNIVNSYQASFKDGILQDMVSTGTGVSFGYTGSQDIQVPGGITLTFTWRHGLLQSVTKRS